MPITISNAAEKIIAKAQKGMRDTLASRSKKIRTLYEGTEFDDISGESFAKIIRQDIKRDQALMTSFDVSPDDAHFSVIKHWEDTKEATTLVTGDDEETICKIAEGRELVSNSDIASLETSSFWGTRVVTGASYLSWSMLDTMASFVHEEGSISLSLKVGDVSLQLSIEEKARIETSVLASNVLTADFIPGLAADFRLSTSPSSVAMFHPGFNNTPDLTYSPCVLAELDVVEMALRATYQEHQRFDLTPKPTGSRPSADDLIQMSNGSFGFMLSDSRALISTGHGFAKAPITPEQDVLVFDVSASNSNSANTLNFRVR